MRSLVQFFSGVLFSLWFVSAYAAEVIHPGEYVLSGDRGWLKVAEQDGKTSFSIESVGGNCHTCGLSGRIKGITAEAGDADPGMVCRIKMIPSPDRRQVTVEPLTDEACRQYCGMRAGFDGVYRKPQALCTDAGQRKARDIFIQSYRAKQFSKAITMLRPVLEQCSDFLHWIEADRVRNDLALAYYHAGNARQCAETLSNTTASGYVNEEALREELTPCDFDNYLPTAQATWHNMRLCRAQPRPRR